MRGGPVVLAGVVLFVCLAGPGVVRGQEAKPRLAVTVWDTGRPSEQALAPAALAGRNDWTVIPRGRKADAFQGDAVVTNGRIIAVLRRQDSAVEVHAVKPDGAAARLRLRLLSASGEPAARLARVALVENTRGGAGLEASFQTASGAEVAGKFRITRGDVCVETEPGAGAGKLHVECPGRFAVLPDFFADDITLDATKLTPDAVELPGENFVLHPTAGGDALGVCVFENRRQDVRVTLGGAGDRRRVTGSEVAFEGKKVWVALLDAPGVWHTRDFGPGDAGRVIPLNWAMPFPAQWRVNFSKPDGLTDSWEMLLQDQDGGPYTKPSWLGAGTETLSPDRNRWNTVLGTYPYPCWSDSDRRGYVQPLKGKVLRFQGPAIVYPISRVAQTPPDVFTVVDVMRNTLGVGPCEHLLDLEGQKSEYKGRATCSVRDTLTPIYEKHQQKEKRAVIDRTLDEGLAFVKHIRGRITRLRRVRRNMGRYLARQREAHPELAAFIDEMDKLTREIDKRVARRAAQIKTPEYVARMNAEFRKDVLDDDGPDARNRCKQYTQALVEIGGNQDELSGECRWVVKALRQRAGTLMALDPRVGPVALEIRARTREALRNPASHEGARH